MTLILAIVAGALFAAGTYLMMDRNMIRLVLGLALLSHAANLLIFTAGGLAAGQPPILAEPGRPTPPVADPLPQALILTAIVISFAVLAFTMSLIFRAYEAIGQEDLDQMTLSDPRP